MHQLDLDRKTEFENIRREARGQGIDFSRWTTAEKETFVRRYVEARERNHVPASAFEIALRHSGNVE